MLQGDHQYCEILQLYSQSGCLLDGMVALVHRGDEIKVPTRGTIFQTGDRITVIGEPAGIHRLYNQYRDAVDQGTAPQAREVAS